MIELLVTIGVTGLLIAILIPAVQAAREAARSSQCQSNLKQLGLALQNYESVHRNFPACGVHGISWHVVILPYIEQSNLYQQVDFSDRDPGHEPAAAIAHVRIPLYLCPSDWAREMTTGSTQVAATSYLGNSGTGVLANGYDGVFQHFITTQPQYPEGAVVVASITDGLSTTAMASEVLHSLGDSQRDRLRISWNLPQDYTSDKIDQFKTVCSSLPESPTDAGWSGVNRTHGWRWVFGDIGYSTYNHMLPPMQPSCLNGTFVQTGIYSSGSGHSHGVNVVFCDGHVKWLSRNVDANIWRGIGSRNGSESVQP